MTKRQDTERLDALDRLRKSLKPGDTVYTILRSVSRSGMSRVIDCYTFEGNEPQWLSGLVSIACRLSRDRKHEGIKMGGCGMDMGFALVYELSHALWPDGWECIGTGPEHRDRCPSNDHSNRDRAYTPHPHKDGGYALRHRWV